VTAPTVDTWAVVARAQSGDMDAFADIYRAHHLRVFRFVQHRIPNRATAEDIASETFVRALRGIGSVTWQGKDIGAWLMTLARNLIADHFKSARVRLSTPVEDMHTWDLPAVDDPEREVVSEMQRAAAERLITEAMANLTLAQKQVIELRFFQDLDTNEAARVAGMDLGTSKSLQYRALQSLRRQLAAVSA
jgi:RNA polymerase sigma-70 factor (ECF subfamily)